MEVKHATMRQIAEVAGVSLSTVFRVLNKSGNVSESTKAKVIAAADLLKHRSEQSSQATYFRHSVGIILSDSSVSDLNAHPSMFAVITSFLQELTANSISCTMNVYSDVLSQDGNLMVTPCDGYLIIGTSEEEERQLLNALSSIGIPNVLINRNFDYPRTICINVDDQSACERATEHLISLGHRRIAFVGGDSNYQNTQRRLIGYEIAMKKHQLEIPKGYEIFGEYSEISGYQKGLDLMRLSPRPTAAIFASDPIAIGCMRCLTDHGLNLPEDFSAIGFGDIEACQCVTPTLTTIAQPSRDQGIFAAQALLQMLENPIINSQKLYLRTEFIIRASTQSPGTT